MKWISVEDRLPESKQSVLVKIAYEEEPVIAYYKKRPDNSIAWYCVIPEDVTINGDAWLDGHIWDTGSFGVTHWMALPEPPEEE